MKQVVNSDRVISVRKSHSTRALSAARDTLWRSQNHTSNNHQNDGDTRNFHRKSTMRLLIITNVYNTVGGLDKIRARISAYRQIAAEFPDVDVYTVNERGATKGFLKPEKGNPLGVDLDTALHKLGSVQDYELIVLPFGKPDLSRRSNASFLVVVPAPDPRTLKTNDPEKVYRLMRAAIYNTAVGELVSITYVVDPEVKEIYKRMNIRFRVRRLITYEDDPKGILAGKYKHFEPICWKSMSQVPEFKNYSFAEIKTIIGKSITYREIAEVELALARKYCRDIEAYRDRCTYVRRNFPWLLIEDEARLGDYRIPAIHMTYCQMPYAEFTDMNPGSPVNRFLRPQDLIFRDLPHTSYLAFRVDPFSARHIEKMVEHIDVPGIRDYLASSKFMQDSNYLHSVPEDFIIQNYDLFDRRTLTEHYNHKKLEHHMVGVKVHGRTSNLTMAEVLDMDPTIIQNRDKLQAELDRVLHDLTQCGVCNDHVLRWNLACGTCSSYMCDQCAKNWYTILPGRKVEKSRLSCPFCRSKPEPESAVKHGNLQEYDEKMLELELKEDHIFGLCEMCGKVSDAGMQNDCANEHELKHFICMPCKAGDGVKRCPGCKSPTELAAACNHILCPICGEHWCYKCGEGGFTETSVYQHMDAEHGSHYN